jgi:predicted nuclease with TOPRIM domain
MSKFATPKNIEDLRNELRNDYGNDYTKFDERYYEREDLIDEYERAMNDAEDFEKYLKTATELSYRKEISKYD